MKEDGQEVKEGQNYDGRLWNNLKMLGSNYIKYRKGTPNKRQRLSDCE
jgi:hypothetical protein